MKLFPTKYGTNPIEITASGGNLWFNSIQFQGGLASVTPQGSIAEFPTIGHSPDHLTAGPDGNVWFTDTSNRAVGYLTPVGSMTTFPVSDDASVQFTGIVAGSDGAMWFTLTGYGTERGLGMLGRVTTGGVITLHPLGDMSLTGLTPGPDGALWVNDLSKVFRFGVDGSVSSFPTPEGWWMVGKPAVGPDGDVWTIGEEQPPSAMALFRLSPAGTFTRFDLPAGWIDYSHIAAGPDGNLWIVAQSRRSIFRMSPQGRIVEEIAVSDTPWDVMVGPDGAMWFSAQKSIGRIAV